MLSIFYLAFFLACGLAMARFLLPRLRPLLRGYIGLSLGVLGMMWLPALLAHGFSFTLTAHWLAAGVMALLVLVSFLLRDRRSPLPFNREEKRLLLTLVVLVLPLTLLSAYLQYTHSIRPAADGTYHVGQSTYGDLSLHLAVATGAVNAPFPLPNSLMLGATMAYPYLSDTFATSFLLMGMGLPAAMAFTGTFLMALVFSGYTLLCAQLCRRRGALPLAVLLLFCNGGLGFFHTLSGKVEDGVVTNALSNLEEVLTGYYKTPTNQPDPYNLRWVNIICDMLIPQRGILGGWSMLMPCLNLLVPPLARREKHDVQALTLLGIMAGGMPLLHTHSFLALGLASIGFCGYSLWAAPKGSRLKAFGPWLLYGGVAAALSLPQLIGFTFVQATDSDHFLRFQFNWCNNRGGLGLVDPYLWFYVKNVGLPYLLILLALCRRRARGQELDAAAQERNREIFQHRLLAAGAFTIYAVAEFILFQPNEYDNNKLFYVWFLLCLPMAADYALELYGKLRGVAGRRAIAALFLVTCFLSAALTLAREWVSDYEAYSREAIATAQFVKAETPEHAVFVTGNQHLNPVSSLAGRTILCSSDLYLYYHGFNTRQRRAEIAAFYQDPGSHLAFLEKYGVQYIYVSPYERSDWALAVNEEALEALFPLVYESDSGAERIFAVPQSGSVP